MYLKRILLDRCLSILKSLVSNNLNAFTFFKAVDATQFWPLGALLRADWKEDELAVIDCRPIIRVTF